MFNALLWLVGTGVVFAVLVLLYAIEDVKGDRVFLKTPRSLLDRLIRFLGRLIDHYIISVIRVSVHTLVYYVAQKLLHRIFNLIQTVEQRAELIIRQHRGMAKRQTDGRPRTHLDDIADHKVESALTEKQREKLKEH